MDKLLNWSLAQNDPETAKKVGAPDPELLAKLFGAADDPTLMKEAISIIEQEEIEEEIKLRAFDNFEMLIENLDNANNIENLKLWESIINQLNSTNVKYQNFASSIIGTSVQNNNKAQLDFLKYPLGFEKLIELSQNEETNLKALYALSSLISNNDDSLKKFNDSKGWELLESLLFQQIDKLKLRTLSLLNAILSLEDKSLVLLKFKQHNIVDGIIDTILGFNEKFENSSIFDRSVNLLINLIQKGYEFSSKELTKVHSVVKLIDDKHKDLVNSNDLQLLKQV